MSKFCRLALCIGIINSVTINAFANANAHNIELISHQFINTNKIASMSIGVVNNDKIELYNFGYSNEFKKTPTTNDTIYRINSFTKTFTATLSAIAHTEKKLDLNKSFDHYFPELQKNKHLDKITTVQLLAHLGGMPFVFTPDPRDYSDLIEQLKTYKPITKPGTHYLYSNYGIGIAGYILESVYAKTYDELLTEKIKTDLKLTSTYLKIPEDKMQYFAIGHDTNNTTIPTRIEIPPLFAAGELKSTIADMTNYLYAQINTTKLSNSILKNAIALTHSFQFCFEDSTTFQQLAWQAHPISDLDSKVIKDTTLPEYKISKCKKRQTREEKIFVDKTGSGVGFSSYMIYLPHTKKGIVLLTNKNLGSERIQFGRELLKIIQ